MSLALLVSDPNLKKGSIFEVPSTPLLDTWSHISLVNISPLKQVLGESIKTYAGDHEVWQ